MRLIDADDFLRKLEIYCEDCNSYNCVKCRSCDIGDALDLAEDFAIESKYTWHDLRVNPDDLPTKDGLYAVAIDYDGIEIGFGYWETMFGYGSGWSCLVPEKQCVVGWKEIEPFENN